MLLVKEDWKLVGSREVVLPRLIGRLPAVIVISMVTFKSREFVGREFE